MIPRRIRQVFCNLKENTSVRYAKIATIGGFCDLDLLVIKATSPDDFPLSDKYVHHILNIFHIAPTTCRRFVSCLARRFLKTHCWRVALKSLLLLHRLLRSLPVNSTFRAEMLRARLHKCISLNPCHFRDISSRTPEDYTLFIRSYAYLLDEALECISIDSTDEETEEESTPKRLSDKMQQLGRMIDVLPQLQSLIDGVMNCRPIGAAAKNFLVQSTMKYIIRDSFICYTNFRKKIVLLLDNLVQLPYRDSIQAFDIYKRSSSQAIQLSEFYNWCRSMGFCGAYEYPFVDPIPDIQVRALGAFLQGMWQLTESSESSASPTSSRIPSPSSAIGDNRDKHVIEDKGSKVVMVEGKNEQMGLVKDYKEMENLIKFEDEENQDSWEVLLEASLPTSRNVSSNNAIFFNNYYGYGPQVLGSNAANLFASQVNQCQIQVCSPYGNPSAPIYFSHPYNVPIQHGSFSNPTIPTYPLGY